MSEKQMIFKFKALCADDEKFVRDYEIKYDATLLDFHQLICEDLGFESDEMSSFFLSDKNWDKIREFTLLDMNMGEDDYVDDEVAPIAMEKVFLGQLVRNRHERLLYVYDLLNNRGLYIELIETHRGKPGVDYPCVSYSEGEAPYQFGRDGERSAFNDMMDDFDGDMDDDSAYSSASSSKDMFDDDDDFGGGYSSRRGGKGGYDDDDMFDNDDFGGGYGGGGYSDYDDDYY